MSTDEKQTDSTTAARMEHNRSKYGTGSSFQGTEEGEHGTLEDLQDIYQRSSSLDELCRFHKQYYWDKETPVVSPPIDLDKYDAHGEPIDGPQTGLATSASIPSDMKTRVYCFPDAIPPPAWKDIRKDVAELHIYNLLVTELKLADRTQEHEWSMVSLVVETKHADILKCSLDITGEVETFINRYVPFQSYADGTSHSNSIQKLTQVAKGTHVRTLRRMPDVRCWYDLNQRLGQARNKSLWKHIRDHCVILHIFDRTSNRLIQPGRWIKLILERVRDRWKYEKKKYSSGKKFYKPAKRILVAETKALAKLPEENQWMLYPDPVPISPSANAAAPNVGRIDEETPRRTAAEDPLNMLDQDSDPLPLQDVGETHVDMTNHDTVVPDDTAVAGVDENVVISDTTGVMDPSDVDMSSLDQRHDGDHGHDHMVIGGHTPMEYDAKHVRALPPPIPPLPTDMITKQDSSSELESPTKKPQDETSANVSHNPVPRKSGTKRPSSKKSRRPSPTAVIPSDVDSAVAEIKHPGAQQADRTLSASAATSGSEIGGSTATAGSEKGTATAGSGKGAATSASKGAGGAATSLLDTHTIVFGHAWGPPGAGPRGLPVPAFPIMSSEKPASTNTSLPIGLRPMTSPALEEKNRSGVMALTNGSINGKPHRKTLSKDRIPTPSSVPMSVPHLALGTIVSGTTQPQQREQKGNAVVGSSVPSISKRLPSSANTLPMVLSSTQSRRSRGTPPIAVPLSNAHAESFGSVTTHLDLDEDDRFR